MWVPISSSGKVFDGCIRDLGFNPHLHQKLISVLLSSHPSYSISTTIIFPLHVEISSNKDKNCLLVESQKYENICSQKFLERLDL